MDAVHCNIKKSDVGTNNIHGNVVEIIEEITGKKIKNHNRSRISLYSDLGMSFDDFVKLQEKIEDTHTEIINGEFDHIIYLHDVVNFLATKQATIS